MRHRCAQRGDSLIRNIHRLRGKVAHVVVNKDTGQGLVIVLDLDELIRLENKQCPEEPA